MRLMIFIRYSAMPSHGDTPFIYNEKGHITVTLIILFDYNIFGKGFLPKETAVTYTKSGCCLNIEHSSSHRWYLSTLPVRFHNPKKLRQPWYVPTDNSRIPS